MPVFLEVRPLNGRTCPLHSPAKISSKRILSCFWLCGSGHVLPVITSSKPFFSLATSCHSQALVHCRASRSLFVDPSAKTCYVFRASGLRWAPHAWSIPSLWSAQSCNATGSTSWELPRKNPGKVLKTSVTRRFRAHFVCTRHRPAVSPSFCAVHVNLARSGY